MDLLHFDNTRNVSGITREELEHIVSHSYFFSERLAERAITELRHRQELERLGSRITETELRNCI